MKDRLCKMGRAMLVALCLAATTGLTYSCSDDYDLPDKTPPGLGPSIYDYLVKQKKFSYTVRLIKDLKYDEVLDRTGSKTLFVADDEAYEKFFQNNPWGVSRYEDLSVAQKNLLMKSAMLDNAYLLEMMSNVAGAGDAAIKNTQLRQITSASVTDSVPYFSFSSNAIFKHYGEDPDKAGRDYWGRFRMQQKPDGNPGGIFLALDGTVPMMTHFIAGQMGSSQVTDEDFAAITGTTRTPTDVHVYDSKVLMQDKTCLNGYVDQLDRVLLTPANMAEVIRTNGKTKYFSHLLDRFAIPSYDGNLTYSYRQLHESTFGQTDSIFSKRYLSERSAGENALKTDPFKQAVSNVLPFDPGWNQYFPKGSKREVDMGAMFVPNDDAVEAYFLDGGPGQYFMDAFATKPNTKENLMYNLDQIPMENIADFIDNSMKDSYISSVPSKYITIMNDAKDPMFSSVGSVSDFVNNTLDTCILANNGVVYVLSSVYAPATYASVLAQARVNQNMKIFNWAIWADKGFMETDPNGAVTGGGLGAYYNFYLKAMSSRFSVFIPTDEALSRYYDVTSCFWETPRMLKFMWNPKKSPDATGSQIAVEAYEWDPETMTVSEEPSTNKPLDPAWKGFLKDMLNTHIIVHSGNDAGKGLDSGNEYFITKDGSAVKISDFVNQTTPGFHVQGGFQIDHDSVCTVLAVDDKRQETTGYGNGMTYTIDRPIETTSNTVERIFARGGETSPFYEFYTLCQVPSEILRKAGLADSVEFDKQDKELLKYKIFDSSMNPLSNDNTGNIRFFSSYRYTVYVPDNKAMQKAVNEEGLPTWESIEQFLDEKIAEKEAYETEHEGFPHIEETLLEMEKDYKAKAQAMITCILNFIKMHFQDNSVFADKMPLEPSNYETASINLATNRYRSVRVSSTGNGTLSVKPIFKQTGLGEGDYVFGKTCNVVKEHSNLMAREYTLSSPVSEENASATIKTTSYAVVHLIDGVIDFKDLQGHRYDEDWATATKAKSFLRNYRIKK